MSDEKNNPVGEGASENGATSPTGASVDNSNFEKSTPTGDKATFGDTPHNDTLGANTSTGAGDASTSSSKLGGVNSKLGGVAQSVGESVVGEETAENLRKASATVTKAKKLLASAKVGLSAFISVVFNPMFWVITGIIVALVSGFMYFKAATQVIGRNSNADGCMVPGDNASDGGVPVGEASSNWKENANKLANWLMTTRFSVNGNKPLTLNQAAAIIGNFAVESNVNPGTTQIGSGLNSNMSNQQMMTVQGGGKAIGLAQWDGGRRTALAKFAESQNKHWSDFQLQLDYLKKEFDSAEGKALVKYNWFDSNKSMKDLTVIFVTKFERAGVPHTETRVARANEFMRSFSGSSTSAAGSGSGYASGVGGYIMKAGIYPATPGVDAPPSGGEDVSSDTSGGDGGYTDVSGGSCLQPGGSMSAGNTDMTDLVQIAIAVSYPKNAQSRVNPGNVSGSDVAKPEYKEYKKKAEVAGGKDAMSNLYASCDRLVATVIKQTLDPNIPWGSTAEQVKYLESSPKWKKFTKRSQAQAGDIFITKTRGHVILNLGKVNGVETVASASYHSRVSALDKTDTIISENLVDNIGRPYWGFHYVGGN